MKDLDLTTLRYFVAVCETGNITRAAEQEHLVASAVSKRLAQLEHDLAVPLFERGRRGVMLTAAGESLLEQSRAILTAAARIGQDMASFGAGVRGQVRLLATVSSIAESLPDDVAAFMQLPGHREIQVDIEENLSRDIVRRIVDGSAYIGILWDASDLHGLKKTPYRTDQLAAVVRSDHPLAAKKGCAFEDTLEYQHIGLTAASAVNVMLNRAAAMIGKQVNYRTQVSNFEASLRVVKAKLGISIVPKEIASSYAKLLGLKVVPLTDKWAKRRFVICYRDRERLPRSALMLHDYLAEAARPSRRQAA